MTLLEGDEREGVGEPDVKPTVVHGPVGDGVLAQVAVEHLRLDFQLVECLTLWTPTVPSTASHRMITPCRCTFTTSGFSTGALCRPVGRKCYLPCRFHSAANIGC